MITQVAFDLRAAADVLDRLGWGQGGLCKDGRVCAIEAIWYACGQRAGLRSQAAVEQLRAVIPPPYSITAWNDTPSRTAAEVVAAFFAAAAEADQ